ncbi:hypothetical protein [Fructilactobacillus sanfranciscensis]|uniref:hypothetical protein n=1 Tax=Fructilactobacillus sanfranciscensis TaxID=1625 RepID=UPI0037E02F4F
MASRKYNPELEVKNGKNFKRKFYEQFRLLSKTLVPDVHFFFADKLIDQRRYIKIEQDSTGHFQVLVNPQITDLEGAKTLKQNAQRVAIKIYLMIIHQPSDDKFPQFVALCKRY